eukprot:4088598-Alexandrium_andersonii.AAC.1
MSRDAGSASSTGPKGAVPVDAVPNLEAAEDAVADDEEEARTKDAGLAGVGDDVAIAGVDV